MKQIILVFMASLFTGCSLFQKTANNSLIRICRYSENTIRISYFDSTNGIVKINSIVNDSTLNLSFYVSYVKEQNDFLIHVNSKIRTICYGVNVINIDSLEDCQKLNGIKIQNIEIE